jgi:glycosyltransferase involved in cell wall biosynthesis
VPYVLSPRGSFDPWALAYKGDKKRAYLSLIEKRNLRHAAFVHCLTRREAEQVRALVPQARCEVIPNAVTIDTSPVAKDDRDALLVRFPELRGKRIALFLSRIHEKKGLDLLVPAFARVAARVPDSHLVIAGPDEGGYKATVEGLVRRQGLEPRVTFTGLVNGEDKRAVFAAAELFALPSYSEGLPVVVLEAMAMGLPVLITRECNLDDEVLAAGAGVIAKPTIKSIADGLERIFLDAVAGSKMGAAGQSLARKSYSLDSLAARLADLFEEVIRPRSNPTIPWV